MPVDKKESGAVSKTRLAQGSRFTGSSVVVLPLCRVAEDSLYKAELLKQLDCAETINYPPFLKPCFAAVAML